MRLRKRAAPRSCRTRPRFKAGADKASFWQENAPAALFNEFLTERFLTERESQAQAAVQDRVHILDRCDQADV